ncbi:MAG: hypothetical protein GEV12_08055 [Micromonosporaceae bacterium]|nr:hypothetical protein [Micromonosporaceae bacterium]
MFRVVVLLALASVLLAALALISCLSVEDKRLIRGMPRAAWVAVILLVPLGGAVAWFLAGRPRPAGGTRARRLAGGGILPEPPRPRAPDDDPEFLHSLDHRTVSGEDEQLLRQWEADLQRREAEQRRDQERRDEQQPRDTGTDG